MPYRFCVLLLLAALVPVYAEVYRSVDEDGNVIFSDTPREGSESIELRETTVVPALKPQRRRSSSAPVAGNVALPYESIAIASPPHEETLRDQQQVDVSVALAPGLQTDFGHEVQLYVDGAPFGNPGSATQFVLEEVERGEHKLQAAVLDRSGRELKRSKSSVFFFHKHSVLSPARAP
jgi:hypothetical protein